MFVFDIILDQNFHLQHGGKPHESLYYQLVTQAEKEQIK